MARWLYRFRSVVPVVVADSPSLIAAWHLQTVAVSARVERLKQRHFQSGTKFCNRLIETLWPALIQRPMLHLNRLSSRQRYRYCRNLAGQLIYPDNL
jgi:hypothetical protein